MTVKRLAGLPDEEIAISEGDLWIDGNRKVKNWHEQRELSILVRDFKYLPHDEAGIEFQPWEFSGPREHWLFTPGGIRYQYKQPPNPPERIEYIHWAGYHSGKPRFAAIPVMNAQTYDPLEARTLTPVQDLLLTAEIRSENPDFQIEWKIFSETLSCEFRGSQKKIVIRAGGKVLHNADWTPPQGGYDLGCSTFDRALTIAIDECQILQIPITLAPSSDEQQLSRPFALECQSTALEMNNLKLYRDVYYYDRPDTANAEKESRKFKLGPGEYFFLGDNPVDSIDSRDWQSPGLELKRIIGSVHGREFH